ncbi:MAG TPA: hypothetical protein VK763_06435 [Terriglobales bacterium]|nr:hypothetical protein [Terriglobales bacterium]
MINPKSHDRNVGKSRATVELGRDLEHRLRSYAAAAMGIAKSWDKLTLAASAVGVTSFGVLASIPLEAEVVYTHADIHIFRSRTGISLVSVDINNDGQPDFQFMALWGANFSSGADTVYSYLRVYGNTPSNQAMSTSRGLKAALPAGAQIGPAEKFGPNRTMASCDVFGGKPYSGGNWVNVKNRYLGLKFQISGETHYGWIRMSEHCNNGTITGYAYETVPDQPLDAGVLPFANDGKLSPKAPLPSSPKPATLGALATGAAGLSIWRGE